MQTLPLVIVSKLIAFSCLSVHACLSRYVCFEDLISLAKATTLGSVIFVMASTLLLPEISIPRGVLLIDWGATLVTIGLIRSVPRALRYLMRRYRSKHDGPRVLIAGSSNEGESLLRVLRTATESSYKVLGFVGDNPLHRGRRIGNLPVLGGFADLSSLVVAHGVEELLVIGDLPGVEIRRLVDQATQAGVAVKVLPTYDQLLRQDVAVTPRPVAIEDLLRRDPVDLDEAGASDWLDGRVVMVTGSSGSIGSEVCRQLLRLRPKTLVAVDRSETGQFFLERELRCSAPEAGIEMVLADLTDAARVQAVCEQHKPDV
ncbi:MAG: polysaccharide biosynthesis protein, partial [Planctomycetota bacterium]